MKQQTLATAADHSAGFERYREPTRRDEFLTTMNAIVPWPAPCDVIRPHYAKGVGARPPIGLERMLRIHFIQHWFNLTEPARKRCTTAPACAASWALTWGPSRFPKGQQWYFGMKLHIGVDSQSGLAHSAVVTAANVHDKHALPELLHGNEQRVYGDSAYSSQKALIAGKAPRARDFTNQRVRNHRGQVDEATRAKNCNKSRIHARVEHVFGVVKRLWGFAKVRCRGLAKNATRAFTALALANIYLGRERLMAQVRP